MEELKNAEKNLQLLETRTKRAIQGDKGFAFSSNMSEKFSSPVVYTSILCLLSVGVIWYLEPKFCLDKQTKKKKHDMCIFSGLGIGLLLSILLFLINKR